jgi:hypothetical protein
MSSFSIKIRLPDGSQQSFTGHQAWMLRRLIVAGSAGLTLLDHPAPRGAHYIYMLRKAGLTITTTREAHSGLLAGMHGRYRLETPVMVVGGRELIDLISALAGLGSAVDR